MGIYDMNGVSLLSDSLQEIRIARAEHVIPYNIGAGQFAPSMYSPVTSRLFHKGRLNLTVKAGFVWEGSMAPAVVSGKITVTCSDSTHAQICYDGATNSSVVAVVKTADGFSHTVPPGTQTISGLTASTAYQAFAYYVPFNACTLAFAAGDTGTPLIAFSPSATDAQIIAAKTSQHLAGSELIASLQWTQPAPGGSGNVSITTPPSRSPGTCVKLGTHIEPVGPFDYSTSNHRWEEWVFLETKSGRNLSCTPNHPLYDAESGKKRADAFKVGRWMITDRGEEKLERMWTYKVGCTKVQVHLSQGHLFWANGFLSHNWKVDQP